MFVCVCLSYLFPFLFLFPFLRGRTIWFSIQERIFKPNIIALCFMRCKTLSRSSVWFFFLVFFYVCLFFTLSICVYVYNPCTLSLFLFYFLSFFCVSIVQLHEILNVVVSAFNLICLFIFCVFGLFIVLRINFQLCSQKLSVMSSSLPYTTLIYNKNWFSLSLFFSSRILKSVSVCDFQLWSVMLASLLFEMWWILLCYLLR